MITIYILGRKLFTGSGKYRHEYRMLDVESYEELPNSQVQLYYELPDVPAVDDGSAEWIWLWLMKAKTPEELDALVMKEPAMEAVATKVREMSADERMRKLAFSRELWRRDQEAFLHEARTKGLDQGRAEGRAEGFKEVARSMLQSNMSVVDVAKFTSLSEDEIKRLAAEMSR